MVILPKARILFHGHLEDGHLDHPLCTVKHRSLVALVQ